MKPEDVLNLVLSRTNPFIPNKDSKEERYNIGTNCGNYLITAIRGEKYQLDTGTPLWRFSVLKVEKS